MKISSIKHEQFSGHHRVEANVGGRSLWFRLPASSAVDPRDASAFVVAALLPAMLLGENLEVDEKLFISQKLLGTADEIQAIYGSWNPIFKKIKVIGRGRFSTSNSHRNCSFFSGGVDGTYTALKHLNEIDDLVLINGFDFTMDERTWAAMVSRNSHFAASIGKKLLAVETNFKAFTASFGISRYANFGAVLACTGHLLGHQKVFCSSSDTYELLRSIGSHPLLDPLWSTEATEIVHTGLEADRSMKITAIAGNQAALANLWVCWQDPRYNCGNCSKCIRTAIALELNDIRFEIFQSPVTLSKMKKLLISGEEDLTFYLHFLNSARHQGQSNFTKLLKRKVFKYKLKRFLKDIIEFCLPEAFFTLQKKRKERADDICDISVKPRYSDATTLALIQEQAKKRSLASIEVDVDVGSIYETSAKGS